MGAVKSCCDKEKEDKLIITKMDLSHCGCLEVPLIVFNAERFIETLVLASNQISSLPPQLFHCQEMKHLNLNNNCLTVIPPAVGSFINLISLKLDKNNLQELPDNLKMCKKLKRLSLNSNPWKQMPNVVTQLISLEELYMNDCELNYLPASVGRLSKLKIIELRNNNLCNLPLSMTRLELLTRLDISDNEFNEFPPCICKFKNLVELLIDNNDIDEITDIKNLIYLEHLDASYNHISNVSEAIGSCTHLNMLNLSFNYIEQLPNSIGNISNLQTLQLEMNELTEIPKSIGKLSCLEELNLCNNKLYNLPNTIGLLRNLRNLNVSRNIIEEFPPEIGSCTKLAIINAAYNRLQVLPSEIGYLNNLKVLDLVGNFLMYLPITIINLCGIRAIWLSANQNVPLIPFTEDLNIASGERFLTNIALPQLGEIPLQNSEKAEKKFVNNEKSSSWNKKIRFAEDEDILPGKLHRTPTPFPKELRSPNKKHQRNESSKANDNYVNIIDGKVSDPEEPLLQPPSSPITKTGLGLLNFSDGCITRIKEANIRRNYKDISIEALQNYNDREITSTECEYSQEVIAHENNKSDLKDFESGSLNLSLEITSRPNAHLDFSQSKYYENKSSPTSCVESSEDCRKNDDHYFMEKFNPEHDIQYAEVVEKNLSENIKNDFKQLVIYSNLTNGTDCYNKVLEEGDSKMSAQKIRDMYPNDVIYNYTRNPFFSRKNCLSPASSDQYNGNNENQGKYLCSNSSVYRNNNWVATSSISTNVEDYKIKFHPGPPPPPPLPLPINSAQNSSATSLPPLLDNGNVLSEPERPSSKQDFISLAEQMKNKNISPPCYEIAKMYSTKAALFENNRVEQLKTN